MAKKVKKLPLEVYENDEFIELQVSGDLLYNSVFQDILDRLKENRDSETPKSIRFVAFSFPMLQMIRYSIPSEYYAALEVRNLNDSMEKDVLKDASGM